MEAVKIEQQQQTEDTTREEYSPFCTGLEKALEEYPFNMTPKHIADFLDLSKNTVYKILAEEDFQKARMRNTNKIIIPKPIFIKWYEEKFL